MVQEIKTKITGFIDKLIGNKPPPMDNILPHDINDVEDYKIPNPRLKK